MTNKFNPLVSIVIPVYNGSNYMREAIDSALAQTYNNIEIIVVNDGSTDNTDEIARSYGEKIRYFQKKNGGVSTALNLAIENMNGEYFSWLSHDDKYLPEKIELQIEALKKLEDKTTVINCGNYDIDENSHIISTSIFKIDEKYIDKPLYYVFTRKLTGCGLLISKSLFEKEGVFNIHQRITQDYDMWFRLFRIAPIFYVNKALVQIREHNKRVTHTSSIYNQESDELWCNLLNEITDKEILKNFHNKWNFYSLLGIFLSSACHVEATKKIYRHYKLLEKSKKKNLIDYKNKYIIEKKYAYAVNDFRPKNFICFIIFIRHIIKKIVLNKD